MCERFQVGKKKGFTLIELLVVIAIIALLLAILMPSLNAVKAKGQAVVCKANLHQWGLCYQLYSDDWEDKLPEYESPGHCYMESLRPYYSNVNKIRTCPSAVKMSENNPTTLQPESFFGSTRNAWQIDTTPSGRPSWLTNDDWGTGSYTENSWIRKGAFPNNKELSYNEWGKFAKMTATSKTPLLLDGKWHDSHVAMYETVVPGAPGSLTETAFYNINNWSTIRSFMMRRHKDGVNGVMADMSTIYIDVEDLWSFKWHKTFEAKAQSDIDLRWLPKEW